jgi:hypothetical protein
MAQSRQQPTPVCEIPRHGAEWRPIVGNAPTDEAGPAPAKPFLEEPPCLRDIGHAEGRAGKILLAVWCFTPL